MDPAAPEAFERTDRYIIQRLLGRGGFGVVYQAFDRQQNTVVAIKTLHRTGTDALYHFKREFRGLADISHPNLVALHDLVSDGQQWFFTMELVTGVDFLSYVGHPDPALTETSTVSVSETHTIVSSGSETSEPARDVVQTLAGGRVSSRCNPERIRAAARQLAEGLCALHQANALHRDIKPSNVLVTREGRVVILDFGLVADIGRTESGLVNTTAGTPAYMSPEQSAGLPADQAADWYAVGVMLFEALTGRRPFLGTVSELMARKQEFDAPAPSEIASGVPEDLEELCRDLLQRDPRRRPTGIEVLRRLGATGADTADQPQRAPFVGRKLELAALHEALDTVRRGRTMVAYVHGTSGIGKSALINRFLDRLPQGSDEVILRGRCFERESVPYKAFDSVIDQLARYLRQLPWALSMNSCRANLSLCRGCSRSCATWKSNQLRESRPSRLPNLTNCGNAPFGRCANCWRGWRNARRWFSSLTICNGAIWTAPLCFRICSSRRSRHGFSCTVCCRTEEAGSSPLVQALLKAVDAASPAVGVTELALERVVAERVAAAGNRNRRRLGPARCRTRGRHRARLGGQSFIHRRVGAGAGSGRPDIHVGPGNSVARRAPS